MQGCGRMAHCTQPIRIGREELATEEEWYETTSRLDCQTYTTDASQLMMIHKIYLQPVCKQQTVEEANKQDNNRGNIPNKIELL